MGSFSGQYPRPYNPVYAATKWWTRGFALSLQGAVGDDGIGVTVINPTEVRTEFGSETDDPLNERFEPGEVTEPDEIASAVVFAASQEPPNTVAELDLYRRDKFTHF
jgi:NADP-dependent 3-hydroxy acid dehydrogenase YdfG